MKPNLAYKNYVAIAVVIVLCISIVSTQEALAVGLKVNVQLSHSNNGLTKVCVSSVDQDLGCRTITLSGLSNPYTPASFIFGENVVPVGGQFKACATNVATNLFRCTTGTNSPAKVPETVSITVPSGSANGGGINWLAICRSPAVDFFLSEPCDTLTTPDGYTLTAEGERVARCIGGLAVGTVVLSYFTPDALAYAKSLGPAVGCRG